MPITPDQLASDARIAAKLGFFSVHVHARDDKGRESLKRNWIGAAVSAIRAAAPNLEIGVSTGAWIEPDLAERIAAINSWKVLPDVASVNLFEYGADKVIKNLQAKGIGIEAGLATLRDAQILVQLDLADRCKRILVEVHGQTPEDAVRSALEIEQFLSSKNIATPQLHHSYEQATWAVMRVGLDRGHSVRRSRRIHPLKRTTIRNQARRLARSYSQSGVAHAPKLKPGFGARPMNNFGATIRTI